MITSPLWHRYIASRYRDYAALTICRQGWSRVCERHTHSLLINTASPEAMAGFGASSGGFSFGGEF